MKKIILFVLLSGLLRAQVTFKLYRDSISAYEFTGGDEFSAPLDPQVWHNGLSWSRVHFIQDLAFSPANVKINEGLANFLALKEDSLYVLYNHELDSAYWKKKKIKEIPKTFMTHYSVGCIVSKKKFHYGLYEIRFKVEEGRGIWPAFWFYGGKANDEIDIFELKCEKNHKIHVDTHCPYGCDRGYRNKIGYKTNWGGWQPITKYLHEGFNVMALEWKANELIWYINGYPLAYFKGRFDTPMNMYINTSVAKDGEAFPPGPNEKNKWPNTYSVDYYRMWSRVNADKEIVLKKSRSFSVSDKFPSVYDTKAKKKCGLNYHRKLKNEKGMLSMVLSGNDLILTPLGELRAKGNSIKIKGDKTDVTLTELGKEIHVPIDPADKELRVFISRGKTSYESRVKIEP